MITEIWGFYEEVIGLLEGCAVWVLLVAVCLQGIYYYEGQCDTGFVLVVHEDTSLYNACDHDLCLILVVIVCATWAFLGDSKKHYEDPFVSKQRRISSLIQAKWMI